MMRSIQHSELLKYLLVSKTEEDLPSLCELSEQLGVGVSALREQLGVAKALGLVDVRPRTGIRRLPYTFFPAVQQSLDYAIQLDPGYFLEFAELRDHLEAAYWYQAVQLLTLDDHRDLQALVGRAWEKLRGSPVQIPHAEHRQLHMGIFKRMDNPFVLGLLEAYWDAYESVGLNLYADYNHLTQVWSYHERMVDAIADNDFDTGYQVLVAHQDLLLRLPVARPDGHSQAEN
jgi:DNA-binding FadR family transcriptional regulator